MIRTARVSHLISSLALGVFAPVVFSQSAANPFPDGPGKELLLDVCSTCHSPATITRAAGYNSPQQWRDVFSTMVSLPDAQAETIAGYLAEHFPEDPSRRPTLIDGDTRIEIVEWTVPTLG